MNNHSPQNPYQAPTAELVDTHNVTSDEELILPNGQTVPASHGFTWISQGWQMFMRQPGKWLVLAFTVLVLYIVVMAISMIPFVGFIINIAISIGSPLIAGGLMYCCDQVRQGESVEVGHIFTGFSQQTSSLLAIGAVGMVANFIGAIIFVIFLLIAFAMMGFDFSHFDRSAIGAVFVAMMGVLFYLLFMFTYVTAAIFAPSLVMLHKVPPLTAMKMSLFGCMKNILPGTTYSIVIALIMSVVAIPSVMLYGLTVGFNRSVADAFAPTSVLMNASESTVLLATIGGFLLYSFLMTFLMPMLTSSIYAAYRDIFVKTSESTI